MVFKDSAVMTQNLKRAQWCGFQYALPPGVVLAKTVAVLGGKG
jgi:hypothetical protein